VEWSSKRIDGCPLTLTLHALASLCNLSLSGGSQSVRGKVGPILNIIPACRTRRFCGRLSTHHMTVTIMVTVTTNTTSKYVTEENEE
jgi:hypothetical protein